jgi:hypothetical protein
MAATGPCAECDAALETPEAKMQATMPSKGWGATEYALMALPAALLISIYLFAYIAIAGRFDAPNSCRLDPILEYPAVRG